MEIKLTQGKVALIDECDAHLADYKWCFDGIRYAVRSFKLIPGRRSNGGKQIKVKLHHCIIGKPLWKKEVDHINGNCLDNRRINLRIISHRENCRNNPNTRNGGFVGINRNGKKWGVQIMKNGKRCWIGRFLTPTDAQQAYLTECEKVGA